MTEPTKNSSIFIKLLVLVFIAMQFQACKVHKLKKNEVTIGPATKSETKDTVKTVIKAEKPPKVYFNTEQVGFEKIKIKSKIEIKSTNFNQNIPATIHVRKDSILWISVSVGIEAARSTISPDSLYMLDRLNRNYYQVGFSQISEKLHFPITFNMLQSILVGNMPLALDSTDVFYTNQDYNSIVQVRNEIEIVNKFDHELKKLYSIEAVDKKTNVILSVDYKSFTTVDGYIVPKSISLNVINPNTEKNVNIEIEHSKFDFLDRNIRFPYSVPKSYKYESFFKL